MFQKSTQKVINFVKFAKFRQKLSQNNWSEFVQGVPKKKSTINNNDNNNNINDNNDNNYYKN